MKLYWNQQQVFFFGFYWLTLEILEKALVVYIAESLLKTLSLIYLASL